MTFYQISRVFSKNKIDASETILNNYNYNLKSSIS